MMAPDYAWSILKQRLCEFVLNYLPERNACVRILDRWDTSIGIDLQPVGLMGQHLV